MATVNPTGAQQRLNCHSLLMVGQAPLLLLIRSEALLHALADEVLGCVRDAAEDLPETDERRDKTGIKAVSRVIDFLDCVDQAAVLREVGQF